MGGTMGGTTGGTTGGTRGGSATGSSRGSTITFPRADGGEAGGYLAEPAGPGPGVLVIQEWWGVQGQIRAVCDRLAEAGYRALAPDLFGGKVIPYHDQPGAQAAMAAVDLRAATDQIVRGAAQHLCREGLRVGLIGFCMGGAVAILAAARVPELSAAVCFYGMTPDPAIADQLRAPLQAHFAAQDDWCTPARVDALEQRLRAAGKTYELHRYPGHHAFMNSDRPVYDPEAARIAWERTLGFLERYLR